MKIDFAAAMSRALQATRSSNASQATRIIQDALAGRSVTDADGAGPEVLPPLASPHPVLRIAAEIGRAHV